MFESIRDALSFLFNRNDTNAFEPEQSVIETYTVKEGDIPFEWPYFVFNYFSENEFPALKVGDEVQHDGVDTWVKLPDDTLGA